MTGVRLTAGTWNLLLGVFFLAHGYRWAVVLLALAAVLYVAAYKLARGKSGSRLSRPS